MSKFQVFHLHREHFSIFGEASASARALYIEGGHYDRVATVEARGLDDAYELTNHIDKPWWENTGVELHVEPRARSTSVGDVIVRDDGAKFLCESFGWQQF